MNATGDNARAATTSTKHSSEHQVLKTNVFTGLVPIAWLR
jgi:hypothetical protein